MKGNLTDLYIPQILLLCTVHHQNTNHLNYTVDCHCLRLGKSSCLNSSLATSFCKIKEMNLILLDFMGHPIKEKIIFTEKYQILFRELLFLIMECCE